MSPQIDEQAQDLGRHVGEIVKLHVDLARAELRAGSARFVLGLVALATSIFVASLAIVAFALALYLLLRSLLSPILAATIVGVLLALVSALGFLQGWKWVRGIGSLLLPRTREMVGELLAWRDDKTSS
ncbi:MAG TPA: phage holin family protein [Candidatus Krumholzibacteria bacterium]|nr:phage holin family protein [Candidatus Krumholzibacteria bacterium]